MTKALVFKLALLGCASSCLINVANANLPGPENCTGPLCFSTDLPDIRDIACQSEQRFATYTIHNKGFNGVTIRNIDIERLAGDDFQSRDLIKVLDPVDATDCGYGHTGWRTFPWELGRRKSCDINIEIDPKKIHCGDNIPTTGNIEREVAVTFTGNFSLFPRKLTQLIGDEALISNDKIAKIEKDGFAVTIIG